jgi:VIT1/CCC1 family predicted Fe2+/Mn2+ transporter
LSTLRQLRKLVLGETWSLPIGVALALGIAGIARAVNGDEGWWHHAGGFVLLGLVALALTASLAGALHAHRH